jgi:hypothetical protein
MKPIFVKANRFVFILGFHKYHTQFNFLDAQFQSGNGRIDSGTSYQRDILKVSNIGYGSIFWEKPWR